MTERTTVDHDPISRRHFLLAGGAASVVVLLPQGVAQAAGAGSPRTAARAASTVAASVGYVDTLEDLANGMAVVPGSKVRPNTSLRGQLLEVTVDGVHPAADASFPRTALDAVFTSADKTTHPFFAFTHPGGPSRARSRYVSLADATGLRVALVGDGVTRTAELGWGSQGLREGTYLVGLGSSTWAKGASLADVPAQRSVVVVVRRA